MEFSSTFPLFPKTIQYLLQCITMTNATVITLGTLKCSTVIEMFLCNRDFEHSQSVNNLDTIEINTSEVYETLISLDPNKAMGIDKISPKILQYCATALCQPITYLFSQCLHFGYLP